MVYKDQLNRTITLTDTPKRIISLVPSQTELLVDLGLKESLVGITKFCVHPKNLRKEIAVVGGTKNVHYDRIEKGKPDLIICNKEENTFEMVEDLQKIAPVWVSNILTLEDSLEMILQLGKVLNTSEKASVLISEINSERKIFEAFVKNNSSKKVAYLIWKNPFMAVGKQTFINDILKLNKFENILENESSRYPEITLERLKEAEVILLSSEPYPFKNEDVTELKKALQKEVLLVDGEYFSWYGSRLKDAFTYFKSLH
ncbi:MAG: iron complex transport system substrate-binding protein [Flavobacteriaceae bacterium]|jgi:iron complex transport system substrate-binding protein|uniref:ABC transporter substrate-binding protein n=1 Tax=Candidatus Marifrigoribacter sp. Uisw_064 TaxID=3230970 RepID=UPI003AE5EC8C